MYHNTPHSTTPETLAHLILGWSTRLQFDALISNMGDVVYEWKILRINNMGNRIIKFNIGDNILAKD